MTSTNETVENPFVARARKLLQMVEDAATTANEKLVATAKLQKLLFDHNLEMADLKVADNPYIKETFSLGTQYKWRRTLARVIARYNFCETVLEGGTRYTFIGRRDNVEWSIWLHRHIRKQIEHMAEEYIVTQLDEKPAWYVEEYKGKLRQSFCDGCIATIKQRLQAAREELLQEEGAEQSRALVVVEDKGVKEALAQFYPSLRTIRGRNTRIMGSAYGDGVVAGRSISMNRELR